jgi:hypothetical protein
MFLLLPTHAGAYEFFAILFYPFYACVGEAATETKSFTRYLTRPDQTSMIFTGSVIRSAALFARGKRGYALAALPILGG